MKDPLDEAQVSVRQAYQAMFHFLDNYYQMTQSDEIRGMLGSMALDSDGLPMDPAYSQDWLDAIRKAKEEAPEPRLLGGKHPWLQ